jgi:hypothetical protein
VSAKLLKCIVIIIVKYLAFGLCVDCCCTCSQILKHAENSYRPQRSHICEINLEGRLPDGSIVDKHDHLSIQIGDAEVSVICW